MTRPALALVLALCGFFAAAGPAQAQSQSDELVSACEELLSQQWRHLAHKKTTAADKALQRARDLGCLEPPVAGRLCHIPEKVESHYDETGNSFLANAARHQQQSLGCLAAE